VYVLELLVVVEKVLVELEQEVEVLDEDEDELELLEVAVVDEVVKVDDVDE
jgi:hypothetical protein